MDINVTLGPDTGFATDITLAESGVNISTQLPPMYYSSLFRIIAVSLSSAIFGIGLAGNTVAVIVILRTKSMHTPTNCYLFSLAVSDCIVLFSATLPSIPEPFFQINEWPFGRVMCPVMVFLQYVGVNASALSITAFTAERYIAICHPLKAKTLCTVSRAKCIIGCLWFLTIVYCSPWLGLADTLTVKVYKDQVIETCGFRLKRSDYQVYYMIDLILFYVIPLVLAGVLYCLIGRVLFFTTSEQKKINQSTNCRWQMQARVQVVRMLIVVVVVFATLWMPYRVMVVYNSFAKNTVLDKWFLLFTRSMIYMNSAVNPILYCAMSTKFRRAFRKHLSCDRTAHTNAFDEPVVDHWLERKIAQTAAGSTEKDRSEGGHSIDWATSRSTSLQKTSVLCSNRRGPLFQFTRRSASESIFSSDRSRLPMEVHTRSDYHNYLLVETKSATIYAVIQHVFKITSQ